MAEAIDDVGELRGDRRIDVHVGGAGGVDRRRDHAGELVEHDVLVFGFGAELGGLEQPFAVPFVRLDDVRRHAEGGDAVDHREIDARQHPVGRERDVAVVEVGLDRVLDLGDEAVVLGVEDVLDRGQADVLVHPAVAGDIVLVQQLVVVSGVVARRRIEGNGIARHGVGVRREPRAGRRGERDAVGAMSLMKALPVRIAV